MIFESFFLNLILIKSASIVGHASAYSCNSFANVGGRRNFTATEDIKFIYKIIKIRRKPLPQLTTENAS